MAGTYKTRAELFEDADAAFATGYTPDNQDFQDFGASFQHLGSLLRWSLVERTMQTSEYFSPDEVSLYVLDPGGAARNFDPHPDETFTAGDVVGVLNVADAAETITFDSGGLAATVSQGAGALFVFTSGGWLMVAGT